MRHRHELTDAQWQRIEPLLPGKVGDPGRTAADNRRFVNAVLYVLKTGIPWADLPERLGKPHTVWKRYDRWCAAGVWQAGGPGIRRLGPDRRSRRGATGFDEREGPPDRVDGTSRAW
jgi:putative transposase